MTDLPRHARAVIIGGGVVGCSVAYHLAKLGWTDVVLLERKRLTSGTTWHAAGLIGQLRATLTLTLLAKYTADLYTKLEAETELSTGFRQNGSVSIALTGERFEELKRQASMARPFGVDVHLLTPQEAQARHPLIDLKDVVGGIFIPSDGQADPANITQALAKGARMNGVRIFETTKVTGILQEKGRATGVTTDKGTISADYVVNCAGLWGRDVGRMAGVNVPLMACEHFYAVTDASPDVPRNLPVLRVPDECAYAKEDAGKLLVGFFEPRSKPWAVDGIPDDAEFLTLPDDWDHVAPQLEQAMARLPILARTGIHTFFNGPESFTPDDRYLLGEAPELKNFFVAAGFNSIGIQSAGGAGKALAEWMHAGEPTMDLMGVDIRRMFPFQGNKTYLVNRVTETLGLLYADHFPYRHYESARGVRHSPLHERLASRGACFGEAAGWERPFWYLPESARAKGETPEYRYSWKRQNWFDYAAAEHKAVRTGVALFDMTPFGKIRVEGPDAEAVLQRICANDIAVESGRIVYTQWLNTNGGIEADLTVTRLSETEFLVVTSSGTVPRDLAWLKRHIPADARCVATDVTVGEACLAVMGPKSRELLQPLVNVDLSNATFPFGTAQHIEIGMGLARAHRVTYVGELGWEIYVSSDMARHVFDTITARGDGLGLKLAGMHVLDSCRIEKAYRHMGHDIGHADHVLEAGLGFAVKLDKPAGRFGDFLGRDAVLRKKQVGLSARLVQFLLEDPAPLLYHNEPIWRDGKVVGYLSSGNYGHHLGAAVGLGYVKCATGESTDALLASRYEIEVACQRIPAKASLKALYDPRAERTRM
jgi:glycine cleavage system aminomethyltransferase T/glycine/D-amino acid oxidase-like deaminating enzyme